jgi:hypothetical protein
MNDGVTANDALDRKIGVGYLLALRRFQDAKDKLLRHRFRLLLPTLQLKPFFLMDHIGLVKIHIRFRQV